MTYALPRVLLVEDDPISRTFLTAALQDLPAVVDVADSVTAAYALGSTQHYDAWLFDANLPDGSGAALLARLRPHHPDTLALAHTADDDPDTRRILLAAGFSQVMVKPLPTTVVQSTLRRSLGIEADVTPDASTGTADTLPLWDDESAARALNGNREHIAALRGLFLDELPQVHVRVADAARNAEHDALDSELHRLRASCGFVGAARLGATVVSLQRDPQSATLLHEFELVARATCEART
ncbi:response regulator [Lysobacter fragariae]